MQRPPPSSRRNGPARSWHPDRHRESSCTTGSQHGFWRDQLVDNGAVANSKEDALSDRQFQLLLEGARRLDAPYASQARFIIFATGRLGMRAGEVAHMSEQWIDWRERTIHIPPFDRCTKGRGAGEPCGYCVKRADSIAEHNQNITVEQALSTRWAPKTAAGARAIPFDFETRVEMTVERFFQTHAEYPHSRVSINRRVNRAAEAAEGLDSQRVYPHGLRATASTFHAARGLTGLPLQAFMGWEKLATAETYLNGTTEATRRALRSVHSSR